MFSDLAPYLDCTDQDFYSSGKSAYIDVKNSAISMLGVDDESLISLHYSYKTNSYDLLDTTSSDHYFSSFSSLSDAVANIESHYDVSFTDEFKNSIDVYFSKPQYDFYLKLPTIYVDSYYVAELSNLAFPKLNSSGNFEQLLSQYVDKLQAYKNDSQEGVNTIMLDDVLDSMPISKVESKMELNTIDDKNPLQLKYVIQNISHNDASSSNSSNNIDNAPFIANNLREFDSALNEGVC